MLGSSPVGAGVLHAAVTSLVRQHEPGRAEFILAAPGTAADQVLEAAAEEVRGAGHRCVRADVAGLRAELARLARLARLTGSAADAGGEAEPGGDTPEATYVAIWGVEGADEGLTAGREDLRAVLRDGPARGVHVLGWWHETRSLAEDLGDGGRDDVAGLVALNVTAQELSSVTGGEGLDWTPRENRALLIDRSQDRTMLIVPFVGPARRAEGQS